MHLRDFFTDLLTEKAVSKQQQKFFGVVRSMQKGDTPKSGEAGKVAKDMKVSDVKDFAGTKHKGLPKKAVKEEDYSDMFDMLDQIQASGKINMFGAAPYLVDMYGIDKYKAREVLAAWMKSKDKFNEVEQVDEISASTKKSYIKKSREDLSRQRDKYFRPFDDSPEGQVERDKIKRTVKNRKAGLKKAGDDMDESITEGNEKRIIHDATVEKLIELFTDKVIEYDTLVDLHQAIYDEMSYLDMEDIDLQDAEDGGQPLIDYFNGRVVDILDSYSVIDDVTAKLDLSELEESLTEEDNEEKLALNKFKELHNKHVKSGKINAFDLPMLFKDEMPEVSDKKRREYFMKFLNQYEESVSEDKEGDSNEAMVAKMLAKALGDENRWTEMSPYELYSELESERPQDADVIALAAKMLYDIKLKESIRVEEDEVSYDCDDAFFEDFGYLGYSIDENDMFEAEYRGRKVKLNKPMQGDVKKFKVYVKDPKTGNVKKVNFGHGGSSVKGKSMRIRKSNPKARKSFRARHNCDNPGPKTKARYWSCRKW